MMAPTTASVIMPIASSLIQPVTYNWKRNHMNRKRTRRWISSIISIFFNDESSGKRSRKSWNIEITKYFDYELRFNGVFSRDNLPRIKDGVYVINLDDKQSKGML